jgi:hypothetical protein
MGVLSAFLRIFAAQDLGELPAERPGFTASGGVVGFGVLQFE